MNNQALSLISRSRTRRSFKEDEPLPCDLPCDLAEALRLSPSAGNKQTLRLMLLTADSDRRTLFPLTRWAGYLKDGSPKEGHRPAAYAILFNDASRGQLSPVDLGIAAQSLNLTCNAMGLACCIIGAFDRQKVAEIFSPSEALSPELLMAIGVPDESVVVEPMPASGDIKYWRTADGVHHVPKRQVSDILLTPPERKDLMA